MVNRTQGFSHRWALQLYDFVRVQVIAVAIYLPASKLRTAYAGCALDGGRGHAEAQITAAEPSTTNCIDSKGGTP
jgi:hypothetical protein